MTAFAETRCRDDAIAIIGAACRYPVNCSDIDEFWQLLCDGRSTVGEIPADRWSAEFYSADLGAPGKTAPRWGSFLADPFPRGFDAAFFDVLPAEAQTLDPQQRLLLEVGWRALETAGVPIDLDAAQPVGVFVAISTTDYHGATLWQPNLHAINPFTASGASFAAAAGRLAYTFNFDGPTLAIDTACSSSLVAFHLACQALRQGECAAALVAGVNALLTPNLFVCLSKMGLLSPDGRCKAFDASGNGYVRAEGCGAMVLKPYAQALRDGDPVLAICRGSAVNQDGRTNGLTAPNRAAQERVIAQAVTRAGLGFADIDYVEAHGTGTPLGDAIELSALANTYARGRDRSAPLLVGSVKTNIGHLEAGAGMAGLIKGILCLRHGTIPAHLHFDRGTPHFAWDQVALAVPTVRTPWPATDCPRRAAVSSFGFSGTNAHVILEQAPPSPGRDASRPEVVLLPVSARSPAALDTFAAELADWLEAAPRNLADVGFTLAVGRTQFAYRRTVVGADAAELAAGLRGGPSRPSGSDPLRARLAELARLWTDGAAVDWGRLYRSFDVHRIALPGHPLQHRSHWSNPVTTGNALVAATPPAAMPDGPDGWRQLITELALRVLCNTQTVELDPDTPLVEQGFTSLLGLQLCHELQRVVGRPISATLLYSYPSIDRIAASLSDGAREPDSRRVEPPRTRAGADNVGHLDALSLSELSTLIEREIGIR